MKHLLQKKGGWGGNVAMKARPALVASTVAVLLAVPTYAFAASQTFKDLSYSIVGIILRIIPILGGVAFLVFLWGVIRYIASASSEEGVRDSKNLIIYGLIGLFAMACLWGLVNLVTYTFLGQTFQ